MTTPRLQYEREFWQSLGNEPTGIRTFMLQSFNKEHDDKRLREALIAACEFAADYDADREDTAEMRVAAKAWLPKLLAAAPGDLIECTREERLALLEIAVDFRDYESMFTDDPDDGYDRLWHVTILTGIEELLDPKLWDDHVFSYEHGPKGLRGMCLGCGWVQPYPEGRPSWPAPQRYRITEAEAREAYENHG